MSTPWKEDLKSNKNPGPHGAAPAMSVVGLGARTRAPESPKSISRSKHFDGLIRRATTAPPHHSDQPFNGVTFSLYEHH
jgi:hypothetical protein